MKLVEPAPMPVVNDRLKHGVKRTVAHGNGGPKTGWSHGYHRRNWLSLLDEFIASGEWIMEVQHDGEVSAWNMASMITSAAKKHGRAVRGRTQDGRVFMVRIDEPLD